MPTTKIKITAADNELILIASTPASSTVLLHYKSGYYRPVDVTLHPGAILASGDYSLTMIGVNWGGPSSYTVVVTIDGVDRTFQGGGNTNVGANWGQTVPMNIIAGQ